MTGGFLLLLFSAVKTLYLYLHLVLVLTLYYVLFNIIHLFVSYCF